MQMWSCLYMAQTFDGQHHQPSGGPTRDCFVLLPCVPSVVYEECNLNQKIVILLNLHFNQGILITPARSPEQLPIRIRLSLRLFDQFTSCCRDYPCLSDND